MLAKLYQSSWYQVNSICIIFLGDKPFLGTRLADKEGNVGDYTWFTYEQVGKRVDHLAAGLNSIGALEKSNVGLYSVNRLEWTLGEYAQDMTNLTPEKPPNFSCTVNMSASPWNGW